MISTADRLDIHETLALHAHLFDADELDRVEELFTTDAVYDMSRTGLGVFRGIDQIRAAAAQLSASGHAPLAHHLTNIVLTGGDDEVDALSKGLVIMSDGGFQSVTHGDRVRRVEGGWRISRRVIIPARPSEERDGRPVSVGAEVQRSAAVPA